MNGQEDLFAKRLWLIVCSIILLWAVWVFLPLLKVQLISLSSEPRVVTPRGELASDEQSTIELFKNTAPSVVYISTKKQVRDYWSRNVYSVPQGTGSGFIWDEIGHVVTNFHVIKQASEATIRLNDGRSYNAVLVGVSPAHDLAVLRINVPFDAPAPVPIGTSHDLKAGQKVFAIGNPFGLDHTLTSGIVSALDRTLPTDGGATIKHLIQTDAAINPGNSGGPLLDSAGRLIGINTAIYSPSGAYAGIGFAVPVDTVNRVVPQLISKGRYARPSMGISIDDEINQRVMSRLGIKGVMILDVTPGSAAQKSGLQGASVNRFGNLALGDIIVAIDEKPITNPENLTTLLDEYHIGDEVKVQYLRNNQKYETNLMLQTGER